MLIALWAGSIGAIWVWFFFKDMRERAVREKAEAEARAKKRLLC